MFRAHREWAVTFASWVRAKASDIVGNYDQLRSRSQVAIAASLPNTGAWQAKFSQT